MTVARGLALEVSCPLTFLLLEKLIPAYANPHPSTLPRLHREHASGHSSHFAPSALVSKAAVRLMQAPTLHPYNVHRGVSLRTRLGSVSYRGCGILPT